MGGTYGLRFVRALGWAHKGGRKRPGGARRAGRRVKVPGEGSRSAWGAGCTLLLHPTSWLTADWVIGFRLVVLLVRASQLFSALAARHLHACRNDGPACKRQRNPHA